MANDENPQIEMARKAFVETTATLSAIAASTGVDRKTVRNWSKRYAWAVPPWRAKPSVRTPDKPERSASKVSGRTARRRLLNRLYLALESKLGQLETSMAATDPPNAADSERETRAIGSLIRNIEKVGELENDLTRANRTDPKSGDGLYSGPDAERRRTALAERLERVRERFRKLATVRGS
jgi:hypothetical protein